MKHNVAVSMAAGATIPALAYVTYRVFSRSNSGDAGRSTQATETNLKAFIAEADRLFQDVASSSETLDNPRARLQLVSRIYELLDLFRSLPPSGQQDAMMPLARLLSTAVSAPQPATTHAAEQHSNAPLSTQSMNVADVPEKLRPLFEMVDSFLSLLCSPEIQAVSADEFDQLAGPIAEQIARLSEVVEKLPPAWGGPLRAKCAQVQQLIQARRASTRASVTPVAVLLERLREVFRRTKDPATLELEPSARLQMARGLIKEVQLILAELQRGEANEHTKMGVEVAQQVLHLLTQLEQLSIEEGAVQREDREESDNSGDATKLPLISQALQSVFKVLQSPEFEAAPADVKQSVAMQLQERLDGLAEEVRRLPAEERDTVSDIIGKASEVLAVHAPAAGGTATTDGQGEEAAVEKAVSQLENIFSFLNSERFEKTSPEQKKMLAVEFLSRVQAIKASVLKNEVASPIITALIDPLEELLSRMSEMQGPSEQFSEVSETLQEMSAVLTSSSFQQADQAKKEEIARAIIPQLQRITTTFSTLSPSERMAADSMVQPLNELLIKIVRQDSSAVDPNIVVTRLQTVMQTIQSEEFSQMTPAERGRAVATNVAELEALRALCEEMDAPVQEQLLPIIQRLLSQLQSLLGRREAGVEDPQTEKDAVERDQLFESIVDITQQLTDGASRSIFLSESELAPLRQLLEMVDAVSDMTKDERAMRDAFATRLESSSQPPEGNAESEAGTMDGIESFLSVFASVKKYLTESTITAPAQLFPLMSLVDKTLSTASSQGINWQGSDQAVVAVTTVLETISEIQNSFNENESPAEIARKAVEDLQANPAKKQIDLVPYMKIFQQCVAFKDLGADDIAAIETLKDAIVAANRQVDASGDEKGPTTAEDESTLENRVSDALLEISDALLDEDFTDVALDRYASLVDRIATTVDDPAVADAVESIREQIKLKRISNRAAEGHHDDTDDDHDEESDESSAANNGAFNEDDSDSSASEKAS